MTDDEARSDPLAPTRRALHSVAEHVLAADLHRWNGRIGLRVTPGGFGTPLVDTPAGPRRSRVEGTDLVLEVGDDVRREPLTTLGAAADLLDVALGAPAGLYEPTTPADPDASIALDAEVVRRIAEWFGLVDHALRVFAAGVPEDEPSEIQLWPEHFDLALTASEVNYGGSPGDEEHLEPYLYVGPWTVPSDPFWDEAFGASRPWSRVTSATEAVGFFHVARDLARNTAG
ncbi:MAG: hypothetical protein JWN46_3453 [Acidimicrobiales bacterium]|nr:hypothetical protein [Acidimicrobiales bacterium]